MLRRAFWSAVVVGAVLPGAARAQEPTGPLGIFHNYGYPHGPRVAPPWGYPGLPGGPSVGYVGAPDGRTAGVLGVFGPDGPPAVCRPRVPVYEPVPEIYTNTRLVRQWQTASFPLLAGYGYYGFYKAVPRPHHLSVSTWAVPVGASAAVGAPVAEAGKGGACLVLTVKVPQSAEVLVDGRKTTQTGTDRIFESPPLGAGQNYRYTVTARWVEDGRAVEVTKEVTGAPGAVVAVDFGAPAVAAAPEK